jgi:hypothetical protein
VDVDNITDTEVHSASIFKVEGHNNLRTELGSVINQLKHCNLSTAHITNNANFDLKYCFTLLTLTFILNSSLCNSVSVNETKGLIVISTWPGRY